MKTAKQAATMLLVIFNCFFFAPSASADPSAWPEWTCATFPGTIEEASAYFDEFGGPASLDVDEDGIACNEAEGDSEGPSAWPEWTCDSFPDGAVAAVEYFDTYGGPATLDSDNDGIACNEAEGDEESSGDDDQEASDDEVADETGSDTATPESETAVTLPSTGTGSHDSISAPFSLLVGLAAVALLLAATKLREVRR